MVVTTRRLPCGALLSCCLLFVRALAGEPSVSYYDGLNETGPWDVFFNGTTLVLSPVNASVADSGGEDERLSSLDERYDLLPLQNDSAPLLEYREPFQPLSSVDDGEARKTVYLLGLFELTGSCEAARGGRAERAAARLAIRHVNERNVVPGHRLEMYYNDTRTQGLSEEYVKEEDRPVTRAGEASRGVRQSWCDGADKLDDAKGNDGGIAEKGLLLSRNRVEALIGLSASLRQRRGEDAEKLQGLFLLSEKFLATRRSEDGWAARKRTRSHRNVVTRVHLQDERAPVDPNFNAPPVPSHRRDGVEVHGSEALL
ncbi:hypothetical protein HPB52_005177 [Rhipicephalus sanguineus]|uniref:Uncharacterized protein n=1 Tax=Rhipicephalus sanguineus TaxID=34632 RepID=A0A9D4Q4Z7_RHISA|nr:hypothetical protein HPB52_005177 [Rhipicephalus sanguineus]